MGCCVSTEGGYKEGGGLGSEYDGKASSFPSMDQEETVKEVLSETHISRPACFTSRDNARRINVGVNDHFMMMKLAHQDVPSVMTDQEVSEADESVRERDQSEYLYNGYNGYNNNNNNYSQSRDRTPVKGVKSRSNSGDLGRQRSGRKAASPARKQDPSPRRRSDSQNGVRSVSRQESPAWGRPNSGERSGRRSRSPGMRAEGVNGGNRAAGVGRSSSGRKVGQSPNRTRGSGGQPESGRKSEMGAGGEEVGKWAQADESLENPLVALECFIFL